MGPGGPYGASIDALDSLRALTAERARLRAQEMALYDEWARAVLVALEAHEPKAVAKAAGVTRQRIVAIKGKN